MTIMHLTHLSKTIPSLHSPMPLLASPMLLGADPKTQGLHAPKSMSLTLLRPPGLILVQVPEG
ncbi:hypothetical protein ID866_13290 [Astraeus odoratus]|nr:hypothetical protein ID866_13290 [Astraeus odoratus]